MKRIDKKFRSAAAELSAVIPGVDEPFWNFYANIANGKGDATIIPVIFYKGDKAVMQGNFHCLGSPLNLSIVAAYKVIECLPEAPKKHDWDSVTINHGRTIPAAELKEFIAKDPLVREIQKAPPSVFSAFQRMYQRISAISSPDAAHVRTEYDEAKAAFAAGICAAAWCVKWESAAPDKNSVMTLISRLWRPS